MRAPLLEVCQTRYLLADGGISISLHRQVADASIATERLNVTDPDSVLDMHSSFIDAGADCITTNTFSANLSRISSGSSQECAQLCHEAVRLARQAAGQDRYVLGSAGPWYETAENWEEAFAAQVRELADGGVDAVFVETISSVEAARELGRVAAQHSSGLPVILSFVFKKTGNEKFELPGDGASLADVAATLAMLDADAFGVNCGHGLDVFDYSTLISAFREATPKIIIARPSAGDPRGAATDFPEYPDTPEFMTEAIWGLVRSGANIIGGCCGVTPEHTRAFRAELDMLG